MKKKMKEKIARLQAPLVALAFALLAVGLLVPVVAAHSPTLKKSSPANEALLEESPSEVQAWFSEELVSGESTIEVFDVEGRQVDNRDGGVDLTDADHASLIATLPRLPDGVYVVLWKVRLLDGDVTEGLLTFTVGAASPVDIPTVLANISNDKAESENLVSSWIVSGMILLLSLIVLLAWYQRSKRFAQSE